MVFAKRCSYIDRVVLPVQRHHILQLAVNEHIACDEKFALSFAVIVRLFADGKGTSIAGVYHTDATALRDKA